jgi:hypothetical protein
LLPNKNVIAYSATRLILTRKIYPKYFFSLIRLLIVYAIFKVCVSGQNCAIIEDSGINTAYTIAHEIGHL